jgi:prepilin-type N-terminal cleavage/methylation domain-containing protein
MKNRGFTLIEILIASAILTVFLLVVGNFFLSGNKAASKGTWRNHTANRLRTAMKLIQQGLDKTAYPSYTSDTDFDEKPYPEFDLKFGGGSLSVPASGPLTFEANPTGENAGFTDVNNYILQFTTATPIKNLTQYSGTSVSPGGITTRYTFFFAAEPPRTIDTHVNNEQVFLSSLWYQVEGGTYTYDEGSRQFSGFTAFNMIHPARPLVPDVTKIEFELFNANSNTLKIFIECKDPFDGRHAITQNLIHMINTSIPVAAAAP